ncbi:MAG: hypothetical protein ACI828_000221 [Flavobacteriales bacterium]|jgi:hypothetical protein
MGKLSKRKQELLEVTNTCVNCDAHLELGQRFCANCGGKRMYNRITWRNLFEDFIDRFLNIENAFLKTFLGLFKHPEDVIGGYLKGMRKKYLPAFSYFAIAITVAGFASFIIKHWFIDNMIAAQTSLYADDAMGGMQKSFMSELLNLMMDYQSVVYFIFIPVIALISRLVFWNYKKFNLVEHFVIYLYAYSHTAMILTFVGLLLMWNESLYQIYSYISLPLTMIYIGYVLKRLFDLDGGAMILKTGLFLLVLFSLLIGLGIIFFILGIILSQGGAMDDNPFFILIKEQAEAQKAIREAAKAVKDSIPPDSLQNILQLLRVS